MHQGSLLTLQGAGAYDAAVHCASVSAARRILSARGDTPTHYQAAAAAAAAGGSHPAMRNPFDPHAPYTPRSVRAPAVHLTGVLTHVGLLRQHALCDALEAVVSAADGGACVTTAGRVFPGSGRSRLL